MLQKLEDQEKLQLIEEQQTRERIKELKKDKERLEELLQLRDKEVSELKAKIEGWDSDLKRQNEELQKKLRALEEEYMGRIEQLKKELEEAKAKQPQDKRMSHVVYTHRKGGFERLDESEGSSEVQTARKKIPDGKESLALMVSVAFPTY